MTDYLRRPTEHRDSEVASAFDELSFWSSRFGHLLFKHVEIRGGLRVLDLGFGTGFPLFELAHVFGPTCRVTGLDIWKEALARARLKRKVYELSNVALVEGDGASQPFLDASFDLIVSNLGINNFVAPATVLRECYRVARPGARLVLTTNIKGHYREFYDIYREVLRELGKERQLKSLDANEEHRGTKQTLCVLLEENGFAVLRLIEDQFQMRFLDGSAMLRHSLVRFGFLDGWRSVVPTAEEQEEVFAILEKRLNEAARRDKELRMTVPMLYVEAQKPEVLI
jgi:ubiquinone/menaquinone biosynthesis C-methylase UbiE